MFGTGGHWRKGQAKKKFFLVCSSREFYRKLQEYLVAFQNETWGEIKFRGFFWGFPPPTFVFSQNVSWLVQLVDIRKLLKLTILILVFTIRTYHVLGSTPPPHSWRNHIFSDFRVCWEYEQELLKGCGLSYCFWQKRVLIRSIKEARTSTSCSFVLWESHM